MMSANLSAIFYLISGVLFILALRGLSSPETSRQGNFFGILGMTIAITVTFLSIGSFSSGFIYVLIFLLIGGLIGAFIAYKIPMTAMPELVAGFHSLVGLAAVFVAISAFLNPEAFNLGFPGDIKLGSLIEMSIGAAVGAIGPSLAVGATAGMIGGPILALLAIAATSLSPIVGGNVIEQATADVEAGRPLDVDTATALVTAAPQVALDLIPFKFSALKKLIGFEKKLPPGALQKKNC